MGITAEEAIEELENAMLLIIDNGKDWMDERDLPVLKMAIDALKKQIPMKPILCDDEDLTCPTCGADVEWKYYCEECGQKIDHEEEQQWD